MNEQEFAQRLRQYRKNKGMTQQELADQLGVSNKTVSRWESGSYPDVTTLVALARVLGVTVDELLDPKAPVRTLEKSDWQNLLSFAFAIGGGLLFYLLAQFVPLPLCWALYLGCLAYGIYLQAHYTYHTHWFQLGVWVMVFFVSWSVVGQLLIGSAALFSLSSSGMFLTDQISRLLQGNVNGRLVAALLMWGLIWLSFNRGAELGDHGFGQMAGQRAWRGQFSSDLLVERLVSPAPESEPSFFPLDKGDPCSCTAGSYGVLVPVLAGRFAWLALCLTERALPSGLGGD